LAVSTNTKFKLLQTFLPAILYGCKGKQIKEILMKPWRVRGMNELVTNQFMPNKSLKNLAKIKKLKYFYIKWKAEFL